MTTMETLPNQPYRFLFLDMDSYFASVEQYLCPELRGKPIAVVPMMVDSSCCIAASYEAKKYGVKTGTRNAEAKKRCPEIELVPARPPTYIEFHHRIVEIVESCIHVDHVLSIDEMLCWLPFNWRTEEKIREIGQLIKYRIDAEFEGVINCTIGVASNGWLAKMASKMKKPNGFMILKSTQLPQVMYDLNLIDLHGIGSNMELRLHSMGIHTVEELYLSSQETLHAVWGSITGDLMWKKIRGEDIRDVDSVPKQRSLSHGHVIPPEFRNPNKAINVAHRLLQKAAFRARSNALNIGALDLQICYVNKQKWNQGLAFTTTSDSYFLSRAIKKLWNARPDHHLNISKINIVLHRLEPLKSYTPSLFDYAEVKNSEKLHQAIDQVIKKFGKQALYFGGAHGAMDTADPKIAFQHIPNLNNEK